MRGCWWLLLPLGFGLCVSGSAKTIQVPKDQPTIQAGINAAANGDRVVVAPGAYFENIDFLGRAIEVISSDGPATTIIDGGHHGPTVSFVGGEPRDSAIIGFTIQHGGAAVDGSGLGGGIELHDSAASISGNIITANDCVGIAITRSGALIQRNTISDTAPVATGVCVSNGTGIYVVEGSSVSGFPSTEILANTIENNDQTKGDPDGGQVVGNSGGGILVDGAEGTLIANNIIRNNKANFIGGGINVLYTNHVVILQNQIYGNSARNVGGGIYDLAQYVDSGRPLLTLIANNTFFGNSIRETPAVGADAFIYSTQSTGVFVNNIVEGNTATPSVGCAPDPNDIPQTPVIFDHNDVINTVGLGYDTGCGDWTGRFGNIAQDPKLADAASGEMQLQDGSPAIDAGNTSAEQLLIGLVQAGLYPDARPDLDAAGDARVQDGSGKGYAVMDMGAFEYAGAADTAATPVVLTSSKYELSPGDTITVTAKLASELGTPTGAVNLFDNGELYGPVPADGSGTAAVQIRPSTLGLHAFTATYPGASPFAPGTAVVMWVLVQGEDSQMTFTSNFNPSAVVQPVTFTSTVTGSHGIPTGTVVFVDDDTNSVMGTATLDGTGRATFTTNGLPVGMNSLEARYEGDNVYEAEHAFYVQTVTAMPSIGTTSSLTSSLNPALVGQLVTLTARVSATTGVPDGAVELLDGTASLGTVQLANGVAAFGVSSLAAGTHALTAVYKGSGTYEGSTSGVLEQVITQPIAGDFAVNISPGARTVLRGTKTTVAVTVTSEGGFSGTVALSCSGLPEESSCAFTPETISGSGGSRLTIATADWHPETSAKSGSGSLPWRDAAGGSLAMCLAVMLLPRRWRRRGGYLCCLGLIALGAGMGCGGLKLVGGTPPGTYAIQITGTAVVNGQTVRHSATETLTVKKY